MNGLFTRLLSGLLVLFCTHLGAQPTFTLSPSNVSVDVNATFTVDVTVSNFTNVMSMQFPLTWDADIMTFVSLTNIHTSLLDFTEASFGVPGSGNVPANKVTVSWNNPFFQGSTLANNTRLFTLTFRGKANGTTKLIFNPNATPGIQFVNPQGMPLQFSGNEVTVTVGNGGGGGGSDEVTVTLEDITAAQGTQVCLDMTVSGFTGVAGMQFSINYNANQLRFDTARNYNLAGLLGRIVSPSPGQISVVWDDPTANGVTLADGTRIVELCFTIIGNQTSTVSISGNPVPIEVSDVDEEPIPFTSESGTVTVSGGGGGPNYEGFTVVLEDISASQNQQVCLDLTVHNFTSVAGMQFSINYNTAILRFDSVTNYNLRGLIGRIGNPTPGVISMVWDDPAGTGVTLANGTRIAELCFTVIGNQTTTVSFSGDPIPIEVSDVNEDPIAFNSDPGVITIGGGGGPNYEGFTVVLEDVTASQNQQVCLDFTVHNFTNIAGMQFSINYDAALLRFDSATNYNLAGLLGRIGNIGPGMITVVWDSPSGMGVTLPNGRRIAELCFTVIGNQTTTVSFTGNPTAIEISDGNEQPVEFHSDPGVITIQGGGGGTAPVISNAQVQNVACAGQNTGSIALTVTGTGPFSYQWAPGGATTATISNLAAGTYNVTVTNTGNGLTTTGTYNVTAPAAIQVTPSITNINCPGGNTGAITVTVAGGVAPYQYNWSGTLTDNVTGQTGLTAGTYGLTVTDANLCTLAVNDLQVRSLSTPIVLTANVTPITTSNGAVNLAVTGGASPYTYSWRGPNNFTASTEDISNLTVVGEYCVTVTDNNGCTSNLCRSLVENVRITSFVITNSCAGGTTGAIDITVAGGAGPYTYNWRNGANQAAGTTQDLTGLAAGNYTVTVTDANSVQTTGTFTVNALPAIVITESVTPSSNGNNGSISLVVTGGDPGYTYEWSNGRTTASINGLAPGPYCVTVTDQSGCEAEKCISVGAAPLTLTAVVDEDASCFGRADGSITISTVGGIAPYTLEMTPGGHTMSNNTGVFTVDDLAAGTYTFTITDAEDVEITGEGVIESPSEITFTQQIVHDTEDSGCTGSITVVPSGGMPNYTVSWNIPGLTGPQVMQLCAGTYTPTIVDRNGCSTTGQAISLSVLTESALVNNASCADDTDAYIKLTVGGGSNDYAYAWARQGSSTLLSDSDSLGGVGVGAYVVTITDASGAQLVRTYTVGTKSNFSVNVSTLSNYRGFAVSCSDAEDGMLLAKAVSQTGQQEFNFEWERNGSLVDVGDTLSNAAAGVYTLTTIDEFGCEQSQEVTVAGPPALEVNTTIVAISCDDKRDGELFAIASGGITTAPYTYSWSNDRTGQRQTFLAAGEYTLTVTDINGCEVVNTYALPLPTPIEVTVQTEPATDGTCNGSAEAVAVGGTAPYNFEWLNVPNVGNVSLVDGLCPGEYFVRVTDDRGCEAELNPTGGEVADRRYACLEERVVITPDGNGSNDQFIIFCIDELLENHLEIYNRWGQLVYQTDNYDNSWEATTNSGADLPAGPYYYILDYLDPNSSEITQYRGSITVIRE